MNSTRQRLIQGFVTATGTPQATEIEAYIDTGTGSLPRPVHLLNWDANSIHGFVFGTTNASGIRGASQVLREIDEDLKNGAVIDLKPEQILFAGGGSGMAVVAEDKVSEVIDKLHSLFAHRTLIATCSAASVLLDHHPFKQRVNAVSRQTAKSRLQLGPDAESMVPFFAERCAVCGRRAASLEEPRLAGPRNECLPCAQFIDSGKHKGAKEAQDFQEIADRDQGGYYAVLYADGNGVGKTISELKSPLQYATFSHELNKLVRDAFEDVKKHYNLQDEKGQAKATRAHQRPICAGDDLVAILPGEIAVPLARDLLDKFEERVKHNGNLAELGARGLALSAGVALGQVRMPVRHLLSEAEDLLKKAKKRHYQRATDGAGVSSLDFAVVRDGSPRAESNPSEREQLERARSCEEYQGPEKRKDQLLYSGRPYTLEEFRRFSHRCRSVWQSDIGKSQLYSVVRYAAAGPAQLRNHMLYQVGRENRWRQLLDEMAKAPHRNLEKSASRADHYMAQVLPTYGGRRVFDFGDMVELHRLWKEEEAIP